jgi:hypothetical protein
MRELPEGALIEMDNGEVTMVTDRSLDIAAYRQRPTITVFVEDDE